MLLDSCRRSIVSGSTPVVAFGNPQISRIATIGINPSKLEFLDKSGKELIEDQRRLETFNSLGIKDLTNISDLQVELIWEACNNYFHCKYPNRRWFNKLEIVLKYFGVSYYSDYSNTACHLDLVQWATDPVWGKIENKANKNILIQNDRSFLIKQLTNENIEVLLLNGFTVIKEFKRTFECHLNHCTKLVEGKFSSNIYQGYIFNKIKIMAWSINPQSCYKGNVPNTFIEKIAQIVSKL